MQKYTQGCRFLEKVGDPIVTFDHTQHMHVGYYEKGIDFEATFLKVAGQEKWCLYFEQNFYQVVLHGDYSEDETFGSLVAVINGDLTYELGCLVLKQFLEREKLIKKE
ncbi:DUF3986 family protein [Alkalicoccobacillus porphyridii]|uniref:DUF3986 family protein n=1 Tax=Alkalicoccobacillus porphyridii TaxID=2597270 RepID=A0A554A2L9_9BACI|nr:DUF3986 family protein [Alkalicoccobacillus porphyridii]TSB47896.1 DUF3986 family protein [Alkalicoccobacillus porphyridii]